jgi:two-component system, cell cycle response regulator
MSNLSPNHIAQPQASAAPGIAQPVSASAVLKVLVKGFSEMEHRLLQGTVKLSQRRAPRIDLLAESDASQADVVMIDAQDPQALQWAAGQPWLAHKAVIWAGAKTARHEHMAIERYVKWPILPVLLYRALERVPAQDSATPTTGASASSSRRILIVDDSLAVRAHLRSILERHGVEVADADGAEAGISLAGNEVFACVLMDVLMPGIDGFEACRRIKARAKSGAAVPVVMLTSKSSPFDRIRGKMAGCDTYLTKPVDPAQLYEIVERHLGAPLTPRHSSAAATPAPRVHLFPQAMVS